MTLLSVIIPTYRRPPFLRRCLESLAAQDASQEDFEVVVVDDGSPPGTAEVLREASRRLSSLRWYRLERNSGPAAARNLAISEARGGLLLLMDDDVVATPTLVSTHLRLQREARDPKLGVLGLVEWEPRLTVTPFMRWLDRSGLQFAYETWIREGPIVPPFSAFYACNLSLSRELILEADGFDERFPYPAYEDMELAWRLTKLGFHMVHDRSALAYHARAIDLPSFRKRMAKVAESAVLLRALQPEFPLDEGGPQVWTLRRRARAILRLLKPLAHLATNHRLLDRVYRAEIAVAYSEGTLRGRQRLAERLAGAPSRGVPRSEMP